MRFRPSPTRRPTPRPRRTAWRSSRRCSWSTARGRSSKRSSPGTGSGTTAPREPRRPDRTGLRGGVERRRRPAAVPPGLKFPQCGLVRSASPRPLVGPPLRSQFRCARIQRASTSGTGSPGGETSVRSGGKSVSSPSATTWNSASARGKPRRRCRPRPCSRTPSGQPSPIQVFVSPDTMICPPCPTQPIAGGGVDGQAHVAGVRQRGSPAVDAHADPQARSSGHVVRPIVRCMSIAASTAPTGRSNTAKNSSARASTSRPPARRTAPRMVLLTSVSRPAYRSPSPRSRPVEPSISASRNVTKPVGSVAASVDPASTSPRSRS